MNAPQAPASPASASPAVPVQPPAGNPRRRKALTALASVVVVAGLGWAAYEYLVASHYESTDNAYVQGNVIQITPQIGGTVVALMADDTDFVKAGQPLMQLDPADARVALDQAEAALAQAVRQALTDGMAIEQHPGVLVAAAKVREAFLTSQRTALSAPVDGYVAKRTVQLGQRVAAGTPLMSVIPLNQVWVDANFKEVQLRNIRIGQPVTLVADLYGKKVDYHGTVAGLGVGTGAAFSLLPAQNATGNWIKVVQRVPVRIALDPKQLVEHPLRVGLSMNAEVDVSRKDGKALADAPRDAAQAHTQAFSAKDDAGNEDVRRVIAANSGKAVNTAPKTGSITRAARPADGDAASLPH